MNGASARLSDVSDVSDTSAPLLHVEFHVKAYVPGTGKGTPNRRRIGFPPQTTPSL